MHSSLRNTLLGALAVGASATVGSVAPVAVGQQATDSSFESAAVSVQERLEASIQELNDLRAQLVDQKVPLSNRLSELEGELIEARAENQRVQRILDARTLDLSTLTNEIGSREDETGYIQDLLSDYAREFETRLHIAQHARFEELLDTARLATENSELSPDMIFDAQAALVVASLARIDDALSGHSFEGTAVDPAGFVKEGTFTMLGAATLFRPADGTPAGTAESRLGSLEPTMIYFAQPADADAAASVVASGQGLFPLDPTLGSAHKIEATDETFIEHIQNGGNVMYPILAMAAASLLVALIKWISLLFVRKPSKKKINHLLHAVAEDDQEEAMRHAQSIGGPTGSMLVVGVEHMRDPRELIEELMYETVLTTRLRLQRWLPFVAICAASAPLLGLLGTVTGIIATFKLITVFGSGDVKTLSGGISEALITTEFGLIVAIPSLLLHAFLSRKARGFIDGMEKAAVAFVNQIGKADPARFANAGEPVLITDAPMPVTASRNAEVGMSSAAEAELGKSIQELNQLKEQLAIKALTEELAALRKEHDRVAALVAEPERGDG